MTSIVDICNRALQAIGTRTNVTQAELTANSTNEAKQFNLIYENCRDDLSRMAPWNCAFNYAPLTRITSAPGTQENPTYSATTWVKGLPAPGWAYAYQYPEDCLKPCYIVPSGISQDFAIPIFPVTTGIGMSPIISGMPVVRYKVGVDQFYMVTGATPVAGGSGYAVGDLITLETPSPTGAPAVLQVATLTGDAIATVTAVNLISGAATAASGSYYSKVLTTVAQGFTTGSGIGATFDLTFGAITDQRVILTNQQNAVLAYCKRIIDPNVMDTLFQSAWIQLIAANLAIPLTGDKALANMNIQLVNNDIQEARKADANEGLTLNDVTPDWLRVRGIGSAQSMMAAQSSFDWGGLFPLF